MNIKSVLTLLAAAGISVAIAGPAGAMGEYLRKETDKINVYVKEGKLFCTRASDNFEMCYGMEQENEGDEWKGSKMKHPDMPGFMTFNGTVTFSDSGLTIKGCAAGNSMCDTEMWTKIAQPEAGDQTNTAPATDQ